MKQGEEDVKSIDQWLIQELGKGQQHLDNPIKAIQVSQLYVQVPFSNKCLLLLSIYFNLPSPYVDGVVGADPHLLGAQRWIESDKKLNKEGIVFSVETTNLIDQIWTQDTGRPSFEVTGCYMFSGYNNDR